jgi:hypothetical protein
MSAIRSIAQIPASVRYLESVISSIPYDQDILSEYSAFSLDSGATIADIGAVGSIVAEADINLDAVSEVIFGDEAVAVGTLFKDLGRQLLIKNAAGAHLALFRQVQRVAGANTEGVGGSAPSWNCLFVKVWSAAGTNVCVARAGPGPA